MPASLTPQRILTLADFRRWTWWQLPIMVRCYVGFVALSAAGMTAYASSQTAWHPGDAAKFVLLLGCSVVACTFRPGQAFHLGGMTRDFISPWILPVAILLPPVFAMVTSVPLYAITQLRVQKGLLFRRAFTVSAMALSYGAASLTFHTFPASFGVHGIGSGKHAVLWALVVTLCEIIGGRGHHVLIMIAVKLSDPALHVLKTEFTRGTLLADFAESDLGILIAVVVGVAPVLEIFAVPTVLLIRRFMMHEQLLAQARTDTKTGLLNSSTWETEAEVEVTRAVRTGQSLSLLLIDIDHFKHVNDTHGHLAGDTALRAVTGAIREHLRSYDLAGRFGGEEFVVLLPNAAEPHAVQIAERLRKHIAALRIPASTGPAPAGHRSADRTADRSATDRSATDRSATDRSATDRSATGHSGTGHSAADRAGGNGASESVSDPAGPVISLTVSVGVSSLTDPSQELADLMAAADAAMYHAKQSGRNQTCAVRTSAPVLPAAAIPAQATTPTPAK